MRFSKLLFITGMALVCTSTLRAQQENSDWFADLLQQQKTASEQLKRSGQMREFDPNKVSNDITHYIKQARELAHKTNQSQLKVAEHGNQIFENAKLEQYVAEKSKQRVPETEPASQNHNQLSAIFVSFSMTPKELRDAFKEADEHGAELYFNGLHPQDQSITDTMRRLHQMMQGLDVFPRARFHPKAFAEIGVKQVPVLIHAIKGNVSYVSGTLNFDWLKREMAYTNGVTNLGKQGPTSSVIEENLVTVMKRRMGQLDMESKKKQAVANFWKKKEFISLPDAQETKVFYIDPTVEVTSDIINPRGDVLARAGDRINPIKTAPSKNTFYLFDATRQGHTEWAQSHVTAPDKTGVHMFMTAAISRADGWEHLSSVRKSLMREVYLIPQELIERFHIKALPAIVSTDFEKGLLRIEQISIVPESQP